MRIKIVALITLTLYISFPLYGSCCRKDEKTYELVPASDSPVHNDCDRLLTDQISALPIYHLHRPPTTGKQMLLNIGKCGAYGAGVLSVAAIAVSAGFAIQYIPDLQYLPYLPVITEYLIPLKNISETLLGCPAAQECFLKAAAHCG